MRLSNDGQLLLVLMVWVFSLQGFWRRCLVQGCWEEERNALLQLKAHFNYPNGTSLPSWGGNLNNCCEWEGVVCSRNGRVDWLDLGWVRPNDIETTEEWFLNASMFISFKELNSLWLYGNGISGCVENGGFEKLSQLSNLEDLSLRYNKLNNSILLSLGSISSLRSLYLDGNRLSGTINTKELNNLTNLAYLSLGFNEIEGFKSLQELDSLINLEELDLSSNKIRTFVGSRGFNKLSKLVLQNVSLNGSSIILQSFPFLETLDLSYNNFEGQPIFHQDSHSLMKLEALCLDYSTMDEKSLENLGTKLPSLKNLSMANVTTMRQLSFQGLCNLNHLQYLYMNFGNMSGSLPRCLANLTSLQDLYLSSNHFTGDIATPGLCNLNHLRALDMSYNNLSGSLPPCLANLTSLQELHLSSNHFTGDITPLGGLTSVEVLNIDDNHFQVPISLRPLFNCSKLKEFNGSNNEVHDDTEVDDMTPKFQLQSLYLSGLGHGGAFPKFLYNQRELQEIDLSHLKIKGGFPYWLLDNNTELLALWLSNNSLSGLLQLPRQPHVNLSSLDISENQFQGHIPTQIGAYLPNLSYLYMSRNGFNGSIPWSLGEMSSLDSLDLSNNRLSGEIPEKLTMGCPGLTQLFLSNNRLQGKIYSKFSNLTQLELLQLDGNFLTGNIPNGLSNSSYLRELDFSNNYMSGRIPEWIRNVSFLLVLDLSNNRFSGRLPSGFAPSWLMEVYLSRNKLRGSIPDALYNNRMLTTLDLSHNYFTGRLPEWIGNLSELSFCLLSYNYLEGEIPTQLCKLNELSLIDLSNNKLSGRIPPCLKFSNKWSRGSVSDLALGYPRIIEQLHQPLEFTTKNISYSYQWSILNYISGIDLSCNKLTGDIPVDIGYLSAIQALNLSRNSLSGAIPQTFSNLRQVESLDLSYNNLSGKIPSQLTDLYDLAVFSVAHNNLSGPIPDRINQFATFDNSSYEGNPSLCGLPLSKRCNGAELAPSLPRTSTKDEEDSGFMDMDVFYISFFVAYIMILLAIAAVLWINPYWRRAWFYFIEVIITSCYYFLVDNLPVPYKFKVLTPFVLL